MTLDELVMKCIYRGLLVEVVIEDHQLAYNVNGFYKSGPALLKEVDGSIIACTRYSQENKILSWDDLVKLNYQWWNSSKNLFSDWSEPCSAFANEFKRLGLRN